MSRPLPTRRSWLQFSLRGLLLAMSAVGIGLVVYRWPWVVESRAGMGSTEVFLQREITDPFLGQQAKNAVPSILSANPDTFLNPTYFRKIRQLNLAAAEQAKPVKLRSKTTYRRGWTGKPEKHGEQRYWNEDGTLVAEILYFDDEQRQINRLDASGRIVESSSYEGGVLQGPYVCRIGPRTWQGTFQQGKKAGEWQVTFHDGDEVVRSRQPLVDGRPHGEWTWTTGADQVLQMASYDHGKLSLWNGKPVPEELQRWCDSKRVDRATREALFSRHKDRMPSGMAQYEQFQPFDDDPATLPLSFNGRDLLLVHSPRVEHSYEFLDHLDKSQDGEQTIGAGILQEALLTSRTLDFRFGVICVVPICSREVHWQDRTGVGQVQFAKGSWVASTWNGLNSSYVGNSGHRMDCSDELREVFSRTGIMVETSELAAHLPRTRKIGSLCRGVRLDIVGLLLSGNGWSCEQRGNVLILHPYPAEEE
jgi:hypothetical protein